MKNILFISNHAGFSKFNAPYMKWFKEQGWNVDNISPGLEITDYVDNQYDVAITRNPLSLKNLLAYRVIKKIVLTNGYNIIHCHTPVGGLLGRLCSIQARKNGTIVIYTTHGFHFYSGSSMLSWIVYYNIEKILSCYTDCIVAINQEDYILAKNNFYVKNVYKINGVGINLNRFKPESSENKQKLRNQYGFMNDDFILIYVAQFVPRKNHVFLINQIPSLLQCIDKLKILFVGDGYLLEKCKATARNKQVQDKILFMGYRTDIEKLYLLSDILISISKQEGFGLGLPEGMACGLPIVCSKIRGHVDILEPEINGFFFELGDANEMNNYIYKLYYDNDIRETISKQNIIDAKQFSVENSVNSMAQIYRMYM